jgi:hypothetical protein
MNILTDGAQKNQPLRSALDYAKRGWKVMPLHGITEGRCTCDKKDCDRQGKHPRTQHGLKDATLDENVIRSWWATWPMANVGIATGPECGFFMVGPDGQAGVDALAELERQHGPLPLTPRLRSGGGGRHCYFAWPPRAASRQGPITTAFQSMSGELAGSWLPRHPCISAATCTPGRFHPRR